MEGLFADPLWRRVVMVQESLVHSHAVIYHDAGVIVIPIITIFCEEDIKRITA